MTYGATRTDEAHEEQSPGALLAAYPTMKVLPDGRPSPAVVWCDMTSLTVLTRAAADAVLALLIAPSCAACEQPLERPTLGPVCSACWDAIRPITPPVCDACGDPLPAWRLADIAAQRCARCRRGVGGVERARAIGNYEGALRAIVHALKYDGRRSLAVPLATRMRAAGHDVLTGAHGVVPVPLHARRRRARGFNQAHDLARALGPPVWPVLRRVRHTQPQVALPAAQRHRNVRGAFALRRLLPRGAAAALSGAIVVLVDDVSTTGATLEACARVLKEAGVREVRALTAARAVSARR